MAALSALRALALGGTPTARLSAARAFAARAFAARPFAALRSLALGGTPTARLSAARASAARASAARAFAAAAPGMLGDKGLLAVGMGAIFVFGTIRPCLRFLRRHLFAEGAFLSRLDRVLRVRAYRASNQAQRRKNRNWNRYLTKNNRAGHR